MKILAADTCTTSGSVALLEDERLVAEWSLLSAKTHNRRLLKVIQSLLAEAGWSFCDIEGFAVTIGPGSFTGLRIGLTTMKTLAWASRRPYVGISSLEALAAPFVLGSMPVCTLLDAQRKQVYFAVFQPDGSGSLSQIGSCEVLAPLDVLKRIKTPTVMCGSGWLLYRDVLAKHLGDLSIEAPSPFHLIRAAFVATMARSRFLRGETDDPLTSVPLYVRPSEAELAHAKPGLS